MRSSLLRLTPVVAALVLVLLMLKEAGVSQARGGVGAIPGNTTTQSFKKAKKLLQQVYAGHEEEYYCRCRFSGNIVDIKSCGYEPKKSLKRAERLKWDHVVPAEAFGQSFREWREGDPAGAGRCMGIGTTTPQSSAPMCIIPCKPSTGQAADRRGLVRSDVNGRSRPTTGRPSAQ